MATVSVYVQLLNTLKYVPWNYTWINGEETVTYTPPSFETRHQNVVVPGTGKTIEVGLETDPSFGTIDAHEVIRYDYENSYRSASSKLVYTYDIVGIIKIGGDWPDNGKEVTLKGNYYRDSNMYGNVVVDVTPLNPFVYVEYDWARYSVEVRDVFTHQADKVNFNSLSVTQSYIVNDSYRNYFYEALSGDDIVSLPEKDELSKLVKWDRRVTFDAGLGNDTVTGSSKGDKIDGGGGSDTIDGRGGNDTIIGIGADKDKKIEKNTITLGTGADRVEYKGHFDLYKFKVASYSEMMKGHLPKIAISNGEDADVIDGDASDVLVFAGHEVKYPLLQAYAVLDLAFDAINKMMDLVVKYGGSSNIPDEAKKAIKYMAYGRDIVDWAIKKSISPEPARELYIDASVGLVRGIQLYTDKTFPLSSKLTGKYYDILANEVRKDAGITFDIFANDSTRPTLSEFKSALKLMWKDITDIADTRIKNEMGGIPDKDGDISKPPSVDFTLPPLSMGSDKGETIDLLKTPVIVAGVKAVLTDQFASVTVANGGNDKILASNKNDMVLAGAGNDSLLGRLGNDELRGDAGDDKLSGGAGLDRMFGGTGRDSFVFDANLVSANIDRIEDFSVKDDVILLDGDFFKKAGKIGDLASAAFYVGKAAHDTSDRIIYDKSTGKLWYDADGIGKVTAVQFAVLDKGLNMSGADFDIIA